MNLDLHPHPDDFWEPRQHPPGPVDCIKPKAKVQVRDGVKWITYPDQIHKSRKTIPVIVEMPENAATKSCHEGRHHQCNRRHHQCNHRRGARHEGGVWLKKSPNLPSYGAAAASATPIQNESGCCSSRSRSRGPPPPPQSEAVGSPPFLRLATSAFAVAGPCLPGLGCASVGAPRATDE